MSELTKKTSEFIRVMNEDGKSEEEKKIRKEDYLRWLKGEKMTDEAKKLYVKDTVGTPEQWKKDLGYVSQAKNIIKNETTKKPSNDSDKHEHVLKPILGKRKVNEEIELKRQSLAISTKNFKVEYAKGIIDALKLYTDLLSKAKDQYGIEDLSAALQHHIDEDSVELEHALSIIDNSDRDEVLKYKKEINKMGEELPIDLSNEITSLEKKELNKEKSIDEKNEVNDDEDTSYGASSLTSKYTNDELTNLSESNLPPVEEREFGLPEVKKYPLFDADHVRSAIKLFDHGDITEDQRKTLASAIKKQAAKFGIKIEVGEDNSLKNYL